MTTLAQVQNAIRLGIVSAATGVVHSSAISWSDEQQPAGKVRLILDPVYFNVVQDRETYTEDDDNPGQFLWGLSTLYYIRVQLRAESVFNTPGSDALASLELVRAGLRRPTLTWGAGVIYQPDDLTYVHHLPFTHDGRTINCHAIEMGFRAVVDFPSAGPEAAEPNMMRVEVEADPGIDVGELDPEPYEADIDRP
jgi:hypothetical protein